MSANVASDSLRYHVRLVMRDGSIEGDYVFLDYHRAESFAVQNRQQRIDVMRYHIIPTRQERTRENHDRDHHR